jgi:hypothetical protein
MHLRRLSLVTFVAPLLFAACSSDSGPTRDDVQDPERFETPDNSNTQTPGAVNNTPESPSNPTPGVGGAGGNTEGQIGETPLVPGETPLVPGETPGTAPGAAGSSGEVPVVPVVDSPFAPIGTVENRGVDCVVGALPATNTLPLSSNLPDPFTKLDGTRITQKSDWICRRQEILKQVNQYIYGEKPLKPDSVTGTVSTTQISVNVTRNGNNESFTAAVTVPAGQGPFPAIVAFGGNGGVVPIIAGMGVAVINYNQGSVGSRNTGLYGRLYPNNTSGDLAAWAWGASRIIDVLQAAGDTIIDSSKLAVTGCSFLGKAALAAGALDERFALVIPRESGIGGVPSYKIVPQIEPNPTNSGSGPEQPQHAIDSGWLPTRSIVADPNRLPVDTHEILGLIAPRGVLVLGNTGGQAQFYLNLDFHTEYATTVVGAEIFAALGVEDRLSYDSRNVTHCDAGTGYTAAIQASVGRFLLGNNATTGAFTTDFEGIRTAPDPFVQWTAPTLAGELP